MTRSCAWQARVPSKFARYFDAEEQIALFRSENRWNKEEDAALIGRKSIPLVKLTRTQSAHRRELLGRLGGDTQAEKVRPLFQCLASRVSFVSAVTAPRRVLNVAG